MQLKKSPQRFLSKSRIIKGLQCPKALYYSVHKPELAEPHSPDTLERFRQGDEVGAAAREHYGKGVLIEAAPYEVEKAVELTQGAIKAGAKRIYEAGFLHNGVQVRVDILERDGKGWHLKEVKSSNKVKDTHIDDLAIQTYVATGAGITLKSTSIVHLNNECKAPDLSNLFEEAPIVDELSALQEELPNTIKSLRAIIAGDAVPKVKIGPHCDAPYECDYKKHCFKAAKFPTEESTVFNLYYFPKKTAWALYEKGVWKPTDPAVSKHKLKLQAERQIKAEKTGTRFVDSKSIQQDLKKWDFPLTVLDFETIGFAIPKFKGMGPNEQAPFQFVTAQVNKRGAISNIVDVLATEPGDPRPQIIDGLLKAIPETGSVAACFAGFERGRLLELAEFSPKHAKKIKQIADRLVDPQELIRDHVYDAAFMGSFSLKYIAPALLGDRFDYDKIAIKNGTDAQMQYLRLCRGEVSGKEREQVIANLKEYCELDVIATAGLVAWLLKQ